MSPAVLTIEVGETQQLHGLYRQDSIPDCYFNDGGYFPWYSDNVQIARVESATQARLTDQQNPYAKFSDATVRGVTPGTVRVGLWDEVLQFRPGIDTVYVPSLVTVVPGAATVEVTSAAPTATIGTPLQLTAVVKDANGNAMSNRTLNWSSSSSTIATVNGSGSVTGVSPGRVTVTAQDDRSGKTGSIALDVRSGIARLDVDPPNAKLGISNQLPVSAQLKNASGTLMPLGNRDIVWTTDNASVASVAEGQNQAAVVTGVAVGVAHITATTEGVSGVATITVEVPINSVVVAPTSVTMAVGQTRTVVANTLDGAQNPVAGHIIAWTSSAPLIASVAPASQVSPATVTISGLAIGTTTVTAASEGKSAVVNVTVTAAATAVSSVTISPSSATTDISVPVSLTAKTFGGTPSAELPGRAVSWRSLNTAVATVGTGGGSPSTVTVTGVSAGTTTIEATSEGISATASITITAPPPPIPRIAYALADRPQPIPTTYSASPLSSYNSRGSSITISRTNFGRYRVNFPGQLPSAGETETVMVTAYGFTNNYCKVASWQAGPNAGIDVDVICFTLTGLEQDQAFTITLLGNDALTGSFGFGFANQPSQPAAYTPTKTVTTGTGPISIRRNLPGKYTVTLPGTGVANNAANGVMAAAIGATPERCQPSTTLSTTLTNNAFDANCWMPDYYASAADATYVFVMLTRGRAGQRAGYAYVDDSAVLSAGGTLVLPGSVSYNSTGGNVRVVHTGTGSFDVFFSQFLLGGATQRFGVHVVDQDEDDPGLCSIVDWTQSGADLRARVQCFDGDGSPDDEAFYIIVIE